MGFFNKIAEGLKKTRDSMMGKVDALLNSGRRRGGDLGAHL